MLQDDFTGKVWEVAVERESDTIAAKRDAKEEKREAEQARKDKADDARILLAIDKLDSKGEQASYTRVRTLSRLNSDKFGRAIDRLESAGIAERTEIKVATGTNMKVNRLAVGLRRILTVGTNGTVPTVSPDSPDTRLSGQDGGL